MQSFVSKRSTRTVLDRLGYSILTVKVNQRPSVYLLSEIGPTNKLSGSKFDNREFIFLYEQKSGPNLSALLC